MVKSRKTPVKHTLNSKGINSLTAFFSSGNITQDYEINLDNFINEVNKETIILKDINSINVGNIKN